MFSKKRFLYAVTLVVVIVLGSVSAALAHGGDFNLIHACVNKSSGAIKIIDANSTCTKNETALDWGIIGPAGAQGPIGLTGPAGPQGPAGPAGNLALAGQICPQFQVVVGFDQSGKILCTNTQPGFSPIAHNADWTPIIQVFNGFQMVLVPAGCFVDDQGNQHCYFPFWIDMYEVTNAQYGSAGYFTGDNQPREYVPWFDAKAFCEARGARLPDEWEWEYAARGPDSLVYPWGNTFVSANVVYDSNNCSGTCDVGSRPSGVSWVGAQDMAGNVWEWMVNDFENTMRALRGGSWTDDNDVVRSANRLLGAEYGEPLYTFVNVGFRCSRSY